MASSATPIPFSPFDKFIAGILKMKLTGTSHAGCFPSTGAINTLPLAAEREDECRRRQAGRFLAGPFNGRPFVNSHFIFWGKRELDSLYSCLMNVCVNSTLSQFNLVQESLDFQRKPSESASQTVAKKKHRTRAGTVAPPHASPNKAWRQ